MSGAGAQGAPDPETRQRRNFIMSLADIIKLLGGVAMFLFGMSLMGDSLKKVAGNKLELILPSLTRNRAAI